MTLIFSKPSNSRIILTKEEKYLDIFIPPKRFDFGLLAMVGFVIFLNKSVLFDAPEEISIWNQKNLTLILSLLIYLGMNIWLIVGVLLILFLETRLYLDEEKISLSYKLFGFNFGFPLSAPRQNIIKLERTKRDGNEEIPTKHYLNIYTETQKFTISGKWLVSENELDWLAYELSQWLKLPITKKT